MAKKNRNRRKRKGGAQKPPPAQDGDAPADTSGAPVEDVINTAAASVPPNESPKDVLAENETKMDGPSEEEQADLKEQVEADETKSPNSSTAAKAEQEQATPLTSNKSKEKNPADTKEPFSPDKGEEKAESPKESSDSGNSDKSAWTIVEPVEEAAAAEKKTVQSDEKASAKPEKETAAPEAVDSDSVKTDVVNNTESASSVAIEAVKGTVSEPPRATTKETIEPLSKAEPEDAAATTKETIEPLSKAEPKDAPTEKKRNPTLVMKTEPVLKKEKDSTKRRPTHKKTMSTALPEIPAALDTEDGKDRIRLGICAMDKKARSKPMAEILSRLNEKLFRVIFFGDDMILNEPVEKWPVCDVLIAFHSKGYPLDKAKQYNELHEPFILNDLEMQEVIKDRRKIYDLLEASGIDVPRHVFLSRDGYVSTGTGGGNGNNEQDVSEHDDHIEVNGVVIHKPFVEKPVNADDHNIAIYYPTSAGGGCKKLFRKVGNRSSEFYPDVNEVRRDGSYIYEQFVETQGTDVKMYTVGPEYGHAEARKSPTVDGKVERNSEGKEVRFPVILTLREKEIARRIVLGFKQWVCGFDLLRVQEGDSLVPYVCDVNGWSFVKNSRKYYDDCAQILTEHMLAAIKPKELMCFSTLDPLLTTSLNLTEDDSVGGTKTPPTREITKALSMRRPTSTFERVTRMMQGEPGEDEEGETSSIASRHNEGFDGATRPTTLEAGAIPVRDIPDELISEPASMCPSENSSIDEHEARRRNLSLPGSHKEELRCVIAVIRHGDRTPKQKLKVNMKEPLILKYFAEHSDNCRKDLKVKAKIPMIQFLKTVKTMISEKESKKSGKKADKDMLYKLKHMRDILERWKIGGLNRKLQIKPREWAEFVDEDGETRIRATEVQLILKWGGNLTKLGEKQAINLGQRLRHEMYPDAPGGGILRLHSTFRHDLKIKTSDEGRVMKTAAAFAKGLLELEGEIPPILVSLVHKETGSQHMLDPSGNKEVSKELEKCKEKVNINLQQDLDFDKTSSKEHELLMGPASLASLHKGLQKIGNPRKTLFKIYEVIGKLLAQLEEMLGLMTSGDESRIEGGEGLKGPHESVFLSGVKLYKGETLLELTERWRFLYTRLYDEEKDIFDLSRVPDVHDNVRFDMLHNPHLGLTGTLEELYELAKSMADCVVPQEYGTTIAEKQSIGNKMCGALLEKIKFDLQIARTDNKVDMRYMINMAYSADLPINSMGRRIRTRLYFTSESHLHTLLNVMRFGGADGQTSILSEHGLRIVNETPELCYLTQILIRLFEDPRRDMEDPKRYRVEILFSPGATATPMHMAELDRDSDSTRFDTSGLEMIGREGLTCKDIEDFFSSAIVAGQTEQDVLDESEKKKAKKVNKGKKDGVPPPPAPAVRQVSERKLNTGDIVTPKPSVALKKTDASAPKAKIAKKTPVPTERKTVEMVDKAVATEDEPEIIQEVPIKKNRAFVDTNKSIPEEEDEEERVERMARILARKYFWRSMGVLGLVVGTGCLVVALSARSKSRRR